MKNRDAKRVPVFFGVFTTEKNGDTIFDALHASISLYYYIKVYLTPNRPTPNSKPTFPQINQLLIKKTLSLQPKKDIKIQ